MKKRLQCGNTRKYKIYNKLINSYTWQKLRHRKFLANPVCEMCAKEGRATPTEEVHHIIPVENGRDEAEMKRLAYDFNNLQSLCKACHAAIHHARVNPIPAGAASFAERFLALGETNKRRGVVFNREGPLPPNPRPEVPHKKSQKNKNKNGKRVQ